MTIKVIGAGYGRTGTMSLKAALEILYGQPVYHMESILLPTPPHSTADDLPAWDAASRDAAGPGHPDWQALLVDRGFVAALDFPIALHVVDLAAAFPAAKVILTVRPSADWCRSWAHLLDVKFRVIRRWGWAAPRLRMAGAWTTRTIFGPLFGAWDLPEGGRLDAATCVAAYEAHNAAVVAAIPAERLLVLPLGSGWEPLCAFLGLPVPAVPYPRVNAAGGGVETFFRRVRNTALAARAADVAPRAAVAAAVVAVAVGVGVALARARRP
ncbi:hypothetical protein I4F81_006985 [Pyropia yezoensis]|uniref:Uncharacterized protein n=1 Tax=Pyropia yezoensis TaxID=2788 RepID=A0ACC3C276_PYRYE|nr:hypothetical protein I4F81_006985 [Neopyropia yezoensis]